jgi:hypothetical protein
MACAKLDVGMLAMIRETKRERDSSRRASREEVTQRRQKGKMEHHMGENCGRASPHLRAHGSKGRSTCSVSAAGRRQGARLAVQRGPVLRACSAEQARAQGEPRFRLLSTPTGSSRTSGAPPLKRPPRGCRCSGDGAAAVGCCTPGLAGSCNGTAQAMPHALPSRVLPGCQCPPPNCCPLQVLAR